MLELNSNIKYIKGVGDRRAGLFSKLGIPDVDSLIHFYPRKYEDRSNTVTVKEAQNGEICTIKATLITPVKESMIRKGLTLYKCRFSDGESVINVTVFNNKYMAKSLRIYEDYILYGKIEKNFTTASMSAPKIEKPDTGTGVHPIYPATGQLNSNTVARVMHNALDALGELPETLDSTVREKYNLISLDSAIRQIHFPSTPKDIESARKRLIIEELLTLQLGLLKLKSTKKSETAYRLEKDCTEEFKALLPFEMTNAQQRAVCECISDMTGQYPMARLLQGDVGSGKTAVAAALCYCCLLYTSPSPRD